MSRTWLRDGRHAVNIVLDAGALIGIDPDDLARLVAARQIDARVVTV